MLKGKICESAWDIAFFEARARQQAVDPAPLWPQSYPEDTLWSERLAKTPTVSRLNKVAAFAIDKQREARGLQPLRD